MKKVILIISTIAIICCSIMLTACNKNEEPIINDSMSKVEIMEILENVDSLTFIIKDSYETQTFYGTQYGTSYSSKTRDNIEYYYANFFEDNRVYYLSYSSENGTSSKSAKYSNAIKSDISSLNLVSSVVDTVFECLEDTSSYSVKNNQLSFDADGGTFLVKDINKTSLYIHPELSNYKSTAVIKMA